MSFEHEKMQCLAKADRSRRQEIDSGIKDVVDFINSLEDYYTTSSCSGRIVLIERPESGKKQDSRWAFVSHEPVVSDALAGKICGRNLWFKQEGAILHACCRTPESAEKLLNVFRDAGFKRAGAISLSGRIIVELISTEIIEAPLTGADGSKLAGDGYISSLAAAANRNMEQNAGRINALHLLLAKSFAG